VLTAAQYVLTARLSTLLAYSAAAFGITTSLFSIWARGTYTEIYSDKFVSSSVAGGVTLSILFAVPWGIGLLLTTSTIPLVLLRKMELQCLSI
jgi:hypothetical protein